MTFDFEDISSAAQEKSPSRPAHRQVCRDNDHEVLTTATLWAVHLAQLQPATLRQLLYTDYEENPLLVRRSRSTLQSFRADQGLSRYFQEPEGRSLRSVMCTGPCCTSSLLPLATFLCWWM